MKNIDPHKVLDNANAFLIAANRLNEQRPISNTTNFELPIVPYVVSLSFALEMAMKAILATDRKFVRTHELLKLYNKLPELVKNETIVELNLTALEMRMKLSKANKSFEDWRYYYESTSLEVDPVFLTRLATVLRDICQRLFSEKNIVRVE
ncbi:MAG: hypothetical protein U1D41_14970 [Nitrosomonas sp.]|jgi:hypothetical protein|uniref:hypothetical protein n=1 Tax=Betaproteobacteria TaxID=28216 RepID=UPI0012124F8D|nr:MULTISPECIES: hypothetical protein [Betaproteobacteria]MBA4316575.1 hypothetical protein [Alcaligenaceae bacterium]MDZ4107430.1 hypothetical protein [Nitrosomonas sp.]RZO94552.1 MAG: hypothetical protein EVA59_02065 [Limnobacter sp.]